MDNTKWHQALKEIYSKVQNRYQSGVRDLNQIVTDQEAMALAELGLRPIHVFDHVDDFARYGEPDWETFLLVASARRDYLLWHMNRAPASHIIRAEDLPPKNQELEGIPWLPRIVTKAQAFLEGSLSDDFMYGCGGDREFLRKFNIHAADFLRLVWACHGDPVKVLARLTNHP